MAKELPGVKRTADPLHPIPYPAVRDDVLAHEDRIEEVSTGPEQHAFGRPDENLPDGLPLSEPENSPLFPPSREQREIADENPPFPTQEIPDESAPAVVGHGTTLTKRQSAPSSYSAERGV